MCGLLIWTLSPDMPRIPLGTERLIGEGFDFSPPHARHAAIGAGLQRKMAGRQHTDVDAGVIETYVPKGLVPSRMRKALVG